MMGSSGAAPSAAALEGAFAVLAAVANPTLAKQNIEAMQKERKAIEDLRNAEMQEREKAEAALKKAEAADAAAAAKLKAAEERDAAAITREETNRIADQVLKDDVKNFRAEKAESLDERTKALAALDLRTRELQHREEAVVHREQEARDAYAAAEAVKSEYADKLKKFQALAVEG